MNDREMNRAAVLLMTAAQVRASWVREQEWRRERGMEHYTVLRDAVSGEVVARA